MTKTETAEVSAGFDAAMSAPLPQKQERTDIPTADDLIQAVAKAMNTDLETACQWLCARADDFEAWTTKPF